MIYFTVPDAHLSQGLVTTFYFVCATFFLLFTVLRTRKSGKSQKNDGKCQEAPGPFALPILGHLPFLGKEGHKTIMKWGETYGPLITVRFGSMKALVINDAKLIKEAYSMQAFSGRHSIFGKLSSGAKGVAFAGSEAGVEQRSMIFRHLYEFRKNGTSTEDQIQEEVRDFMEKLEKSTIAPKGEKTEKSTMSTSNKKIAEGTQISGFFHHNVMNAIWKVLTGITFEENDVQMRSVFRSLQQATYSETPYEDIALLIPKFGSWFPSLDLKVHRFNEATEFVRQKIFQHNKTRVPGLPRDFTDAYLDRVDSTADKNSTLHKSQDFQAVTTRDIFVAALETTSTALEWTILNLVQNPQVQSKLRAEIDTVVGFFRLPALLDRPRMPYLESVIHEVLRMTPVIPLIVFRGSIEDATFHGHFVPKDTAIIANIYAAHHNPNVWDEPEKFKPERFLEPSGERLKKVEDWVPFGWGKRGCPGQGFARDQLFLYISSLVQRFEFLPCEGTPKGPEAKVGFLACPQNFRALIKPR